jgi:hypothetical protein
LDATRDYEEPSGGAEVCVISLMETIPGCSRMLRDAQDSCTRC